MAKIKLKTVLNKSGEQLKRANKATLTRYYKKLQGTVSGRVRTLNKSGVYSQALEKLNKTGGTLKAGRKASRQDLIKEIRRAQEFLGKQSSGVRGINRIQKRVENIAPHAKGVSQRQQGDAWALVDKYLEEYPAFSKEDRYQVFDTMLVETGDGKLTKAGEKRVMEKVIKLREEGTARGYEDYISYDEWYNG